PQRLRSRLATVRCCNLEVWDKVVGANAEGAPRSAPSRIDHSPPCADRPAKTSGQAGSVRFGESNARACLYRDAFRGKRTDPAACRAEPRKRSDSEWPAQDRYASRDR